MCRGKTILLALIVVAATTGCRQQMAEAPVYEPLEQSYFFEDGRASRKPVEGTVPRGHLQIDDHFYTGKVNGQLVSSYPFEITEEVLERGRERFDIFCSPCHGRIGEGNGIVVQRGHRKPPSFHEPRMLEQPVGHWIDVMTSGFGAMPSYADQVPPHDRWAIAAYVQALQLSRATSAGELPAGMRARMTSAMSGETAMTGSHQEPAHE